MKPIEYKAKILPDGHLPLPEGIPAKAGDEVQVTIALSDAPEGEPEAPTHWEYLLKHWVGVGKSRSTDVAERHDDYLYGRE
jgi:hypothetical protein